MAFRWILAGLALVAGAASARAGAANNLVCIDSGYSRAEARLFDSYLAGFTIAQLNAPDDRSMDALAPVIAKRADACAKRHGWSSSARFEAVYYKISSVISSAVERHAPISAQQLTALKQSVAKADQTWLRSAILPSVQAGTAGSAAPEIEDKNAKALADMIVAAGVEPNDTNAEFFGLWLGTRITAEDAAKAFAAK